MKNSLKKRGQKIVSKVSRFSRKAAEGGKEHVEENLVKRISSARNVRLLILEWVLLEVSSRWESSLSRMHDATQ